MNGDVGKSKEMFSIEDRDTKDAEPRQEKHIELKSIRDSPYRLYLFEWQPKQHTSYCPSSPWH